MVLGLLLRDEEEQHLRFDFELVSQRNDPNDSHSNGNNTSSGISRFLSNEDDGMKKDFKRGTVVCRHWLRGLCMKGDSCEFLHQVRCILSKLRNRAYCHKLIANNSTTCPKCPNVAGEWNAKFQNVHFVMFQMKIVWNVHFIDKDSALMVPIVAIGNAMSAHNIRSYTNDIVS